MASRAINRAMGALALNLPLLVSWTDPPDPGRENVSVRRTHQTSAAPKLAVSRDAAHTPAGVADWRGRPARSRVRPRWPGTPPSSCSWRRSRAAARRRVRQEPSLTVSGGDARRDDGGAGAPAGEDAPRIAVVTHGQASSPFWAIVRTGVEAAERQMNVQVDYEAPDVYSPAAHDRADRRRGRGQARRARRLLPRARPGARDPPRREGRHPGHHDQLGQRRRSARSACSRTSASPRAGPGSPRAGASRARACDARCASTSRSATSASTPAAPGLRAGDARGRRRRSRVLGDRRPERRHAAADRERGRRPAGSTASSPPTPPAGCRRSTPSPRSRARPREGRRLRPRPRHAARRRGRASCCSPSTSSPTSRATCRWSCSPTAPATACCRRRATWSRRARTSSPARTPPRRSSSASDRSAEHMRRVACHTPLSARGGTRTHTPSRDSRV